ncbi:interference hedgehog isoform X1 [Drosophila miranda]|uniref:interference hedgehog isoform X1 n=1 Tax=Drosophila miranda TaxID=7229 RepID=UPI0007E842B3|nr:interference hedgehog isoform X1 [Drosophila miranda]XP_017136971.1 interference hedgehog isoform X1 [Drosophila miranda]XP_017136974.1 interference hedgehog isoform X1 [Drosophila miranda]XP_017136976.1 interference hedgehog isoform X1 [Drosophila miranda]XP_033242495.1 interference hedgehog isoform X1 [Drosophila miranda]XP_033242496.1 interference hedgehog isoform X1 [Drosophila miranda]XP_033242497.1 interference hedgehog isoform X1 [Drosophila miranda]
MARLVTLCLALTLILSLALSSRTSSSSPSTLGVYIERAPESAVAPKGDEVVFECEMNLKPDRLEWRFRENGSVAYRYLRPSGGYNVTNSNEERTWKLRIYVSPQTVGDYQCVAWYGPGALASTPARLTLVSISIDNLSGYSRPHAVRWSVAPRNCVLIRCGTVTSSPPAIWSFYRNGEKLPQTEMLVSGAGGALVLSSVGTKDAGNYTCAATNAITGVEVRLPQVIDLRVDYTDRTQPYFLQQPASQLQARPGETIILECPGVGSPRPEAVWSSPTLPSINHNRSRVLAYGLQITDVRPEDQGSYVCRLDNGIAPVRVHMIKLQVLERPSILRGPAATLTNEGDSLTLECSATGNPQPEIYWLLNGEDASTDNETLAENRSLLIHHVQKRHAGVVQCFARNTLGEISEGNMLRVNPLQISGEDYQPLGNVPMRSSHDSGSGGSSSGSGFSSSSGSGGGSRNKGKRKYNRLDMVPPSRPNVTRLADDAVMLRWNVPRNDGLSINFFKVQYRMLGDSFRKIPRENWQTTNENIPYGYWKATRGRDRHDRDQQQQHEVTVGPKNFTSSVTGLRPDRYYRFRIVAVYSNNDNKEGNTSLKFFLERGVAKSNLPVPDLRDVEPYSESAVLLHWTLASAAVPATATGSSSDSSIDGYYAYYRPTDSAGEYLKATVDGGHTRRFKIDMLRAGTAYEFKLQTFNAHAASEFSAIRQARTKKLNEPTASSTTPLMVPANQGKPSQSSIYPVIAGAAVVGLLLLIATVVACLRRRKNSQPEDENKPQLEHIQADFVTSAVLGVGGHHKSGGDVRRLNGVIPRMNITPNPLAQDTASDKNRNVMELRFMPPLSNGHGKGNGIHCRPGGGREEAAEDEDALQAMASSSCETLEACDGISQQQQEPSPSPSMDAPSKPLPPLPKKSTSATNATTATGAGAGSSSGKPVNGNAGVVAAMHQSGLHHAQPYHPPGTPTMLHKRLDYHQQQLQQQPPPVPPHASYYQQQQAPIHLPGACGPSPMLERSVRGLQQHQQPSYGAGFPEDGTPTPSRIPSLRRQRRASGSQHNSHSNLNLNHHQHHNNNNNLPPHHQHLHHHQGHQGLVGIPIVPGSPRVQRSPMPSRAMIKRTRLGSHTDNISSGSLNSIEV